MSHLIRWRDPGMWPYVAAHVPPGRTVVTDYDRALQAGHAAFVGLPARQHHQYGLLWKVVLEDGFQPSGLLLVCLSALAPVLGHGSSTVPKRFGRHCADAGLWCRVPGKLYPHPRGLAPGARARCYLVLSS